jgi:hypothetical protein
MMPWYKIEEHGGSLTINGVRCAGGVTRAQAAAALKGLEDPGAAGRVDAIRQRLTEAGLIDWRAKTRKPVTREQELRVRTCDSETDLIRRAAEVAGQNVSDWTREVLIREARKILGG